jgi:phospholipase D-like protein
VVFGGFIVFFFALVVAGIALFIYALVDVIRMPNDASFNTGTQLVWILVILLAQGVGAIIYLAVGRPPGGATGARERLAQPPMPPPAPV